MIIAILIMALVSALAVSLVHNLYQREEIRYLRNELSTYTYGIEPIDPEVTTYENW